MTKRCFANLSYNIHRNIKTALVTMSKTEKIRIAVRQIWSKLWALSDKKPNNMALPSESTV